ncbi:glycosyltransferase family 2 protein [Planktothrix agardhii]|uniref:glycosyltransferase family 2 protein n=1 Tax=Planktothrix agardhii TaxID=1160 RepID=UPI001D09D759|nr:glycosyltransferase [Planktothrix agardhii]MCB8761125.1 glycosyltransferase [Planktothrix agardhii 1813]
MQKISQNPLISVIIPCYKHEKFVERCLNSVAAQTYDNIEVIIVDDCSPDNSVKKIEQIINSKSWIAKFDNRTKFYPFNQNQGAHNAINHGIKQSTGELIAILNSDDLYHQDRLSRIVEVMQNQNHQFVFTRVQYIDDNDTIITDSHYMAQSYFRAQKNIKLKQFPSLGFACLSFSISISTGNFVFSKALYNALGAFKDYRYCHDWDFLLRALVHTEPFFLEEDLYYYRFHGKNTFESLQAIGPIESAELLRNFFSQVQLKPTPNPIAPSPLNWPGFFELFVRWYGLERFLQ